MSAFKDLSLPLLPGYYYHIFNRGNEQRYIFFNKENYRYFLQRYADYTLGYFDTYSYCLLDNHFHLLVKPKTEEDILSKALDDFETVDKLFFDRYAKPWLQSIGVKQTDGLTVLSELLNLMAQNTFEPTENLHSITHLEQLNFKTQLCSHLVSERFRRFLLSYAKSINKEQKRTGSLFQKAFRRKLVEDMHDLKRVATYIHHNVIHHNYAYRYESYPWSSYQTISSNFETKLCKEELLSWFHGMDFFLTYHENYRKHKWDNEYFFIEEDI